MTGISTTDFIFMLETYAGRQKKYYEGNMYNVPSHIARRLVARGIASYTVPKPIKTIPPILKEITPKLVIKPILEPKPKSVIIVESKPSIKTKIKIGFVPHQSIDRKQIAGGTRIRVLNIVKHIENCVVSYNYEGLKNCDVVIFQARWLATDIELAKNLYEDGVKLIFDTTDPHWDTKNFDITGRKRKAFDQILRFVSLLTLPTENLKKSFLKYRQDKKIIILPDNVDLEKHNKTKLHKEKEQYTIVWFGCRVNIVSLDLARKDLEKLGKEFNLKVIAIYDQGYNDMYGNLWEVKPYKNLELEIREWSDEETIKAILESDIVLNPKYRNWKKYKSGNKSRKGLALGVPAVEYNYYKNIKKLLLSATLRNKIGREGREYVKKYGSKVIAKKLEKICDSLIRKKQSKRKKRIAVVTAIAGGFDKLHEPEFCDDNVDYLAFVDFKTKSNIWKIIPIEYSHFKQPRMTAKQYKILIHRFADYDYTLWVDGSLVLRGYITELIDKFLKDSDMALFKHRFRDCMYAEYYASLNNKQHAVGEPLSVREKQIIRYKKEGIPKEFGLYECTFILRKNTKKIQKFNNEWWSEVSIASSSDQVPFMYTLWKNPRIKVATISNGDAHKNKWAYYVEHGKDKYV